MSPFRKVELRMVKRVGDWNYYGSNKVLELTYNYDSNSVTFLKEDTSSYLVFDNGEWPTVKPDRQARYIGSYAYIYDFFARELASSYSSKAGRNKINTVLLLELEFSENGQLVKHKVIGDQKKYFEDAIDKMSEAIPEHWIPAIYNNKPCKSKLAFPIVYTSETREVKQPKVENINYEGRLMEPIRVVAY